MDSNPFRKALERFDGGRGWTQKTFYRLVVRENLSFEEAIHVPDDQRYQEQWCSVGVIGSDHVLISYLWDVIQDQYPDFAPRALGITWVTAWNDDPQRTFAEVERIFEKSAIRWDELHA